MPEAIPFRPGVPQQRVDVTLSGVTYGIVAHWNGREDGEEGGAYYLNVYEEDDTPIAIGLKVVLGVLLGRRYTHEFFSSGARALIAVDLGNSGRECGVDELGGRIQVWYLTELDLLLARQPPLEIPAK